MHSRISSLGMPALLLSLAVVSAIASPVGGKVVGLQSPLSPVAPFASPTAAQVEYMETPVMMFSAAFRTSPLPWVVVGVVLFGALATGVVVWARRRASR